MTVLGILIVILILAWLFGALVIPAGTSLVHLLLVLVLILVVLRLLSGRGPRVL